MSQSNSKSLLSLKSLKQSVGVSHKCVVAIIYKFVTFLHTPVGRVDSINLFNTCDEV